MSKKKFSIDLSSVSSSLTSYDKDFHKKLRKKSETIWREKEKKGETIWGERKCQTDRQTEIALDTSGQKSHVKSSPKFSWKTFLKVKIIIYLNKTSFEMLTYF